MAVTMASISDAYQGVEGHLVLEALAEHYSTTRLRYSWQEDITQLVLHQYEEMVEILTRLWWVTAKEEPPYRDAGMMEEMMPFFKPGGKCYETRHFVSCKTRNEDCWLDDSGQQPFAWIGSSGFFANVTGRTDCRKLGSATMYDPLLEAFGLTERRTEFATYVNELLLQEMRYAVARLRATNMPLPPIQINAAIDLAWLPPEADGGFPIPVSTDAFFS